MKGIWVYRPPGRLSQVSNFIEGLEPRLRERVLLHLYQMSLPQKPEMKEPHFKRFSLERYSDNFVLTLLYEILSKKTSQRVRLPDGVFDMTTAVHGICER